MYTRSVKLVLVLLLVVCLGGALPLWSQSSSTGTVAGGVTDQSNAVVPAAAVTLTDTSTNTARSTTTNKDGRYVFVDVTPGVYDISVAKSGFATTKTARQEVKVGESLTINLALQVGGANVVVEVSATGTELQTMNATVGNTVTAIAIDNLPSIGRDVSTFVTLQPGVGTDGSVAGAYQDQNYFSLDGGDNTNDLDGSGSVYTPNIGVGDPTGGVAGQYFGVSGASGVVPTPQDSVEEFKVNTANQTADFNSSAGAEIKVVTKRGTSAYHGTGYEYYKDNNWSQNTWQNTFFDIARPSFHYSRFGGAIGGPLIPTNLVDTKTFFFFNYEGFRFPNSETINRNVPSAALLAGNITDPVTGTVYPLAAQDPLGVGLNPLVSQVWNTWEPQSNTPGNACAGGLSLCDGVNEQGFTGNLSLPTTSKIAVIRVDHDFSAKEHVMASWRYYNLKAASDDQVDIGGYFPGDTKGVPASLSSDPIQDWYGVVGLTSNITTNTTNDLHYSWLRNWWAWARQGGPVQTCPDCAGLGGALEIMSGEAAGQAQNLAPYNVNNQQIRTRFWDGHDSMLRDDISILKGNHLFGVGGIYQHNFNWHERNDGGGYINAYPVYSLGNGAAGSGLAADVPVCTATTDIPNCGALTAAALGIVTVANQAFTRSGTNLSLNAPLTPAFDQSTIPYYNVYFSDTWHMKPSFSLTYGLGWALEMPPTEKNGKQVVMVDQANQPIEVTSYLATRARMAEAGQVYNPEIGFGLTGNTGSGNKYPYNPYYGEFSPRVAAAWNPHFDNDSMAGRLFGHEDTVIRGGYGRSYGRLNGVTQVLIPLLGLGLIQQTQCTQNAFAGCGGGAPTLSNAFRVGTAASGSGPTSGLIAPIPVPTATLPQPDYPGFNNTSTAAASTLDPNFRPSAIDSFDLTIQRQVSRRISLEVGYIGRRITNEFQPMALNTVPYMMTLGGQQFKQAYANLVLQYCGGTAGLAAGGCGGSAGPLPINSITAQPFFETALGGPTSAYCSTAVGGVTPTNCTQAVALNEGATGTTNLNNAQVFGLWSDLDNGQFIFPRSMMNTPIPASVSPIYGAGINGQASSGVQIDASTGHANYNGAFFSLKMADWKGFTMQSNFTLSKALGTGTLYQAVSAYAPLDSFDLDEEYGRQAFDRKVSYNAFFIYQPPFFKGQSGPMGRLLGGWTLASVFTAGSGTPVEEGTSYCCGQEFGGADDINFGTDVNAVPVSPGTEQKYHANYNQPSSGLPVNGFKTGVADINNWRNPILGLDNRDCGAGCVSGQNFWNMDFSIKKNVLVAEGVSVELQGVFTNVFGHNQWFDGEPCLCNPTAWGALPGQTNPTGPRNVEVGLRFKF
ncbi:MAG: carboxypeptidase-like regulatory domain-containing protein [Candidatus Sulfotelmatobacter sp.]